MAHELQAALYFEGEAAQDEQGSGRGKQTDLKPLAPPPIPPLTRLAWEDPEATSMDSSPRPDKGQGCFPPSNDN